MEVRPFERDEYELLRQLRLRMLDDAPDAFTITAESERSKPMGWWRDRLVSTVTDPARLVLVVELDDEPIGSVLGVIDTFDRTHAHLYALWVDPKVRRKGAATALIDAVFEWARGRGAQTIDLSVTVGNLAACKLYEQHGFLDTGEREPLRAGSPLRLMKMRAPL